MLRQFDEAIVRIVESRNQRNQRNQHRQHQAGESHDPSIVKANGKYYIFGSHRAWLKSGDLVNWTSFKNNLSTDYETIFADIWEEWAKQSTNPDVKGNMWAPDVV